MAAERKKRKVKTREPSPRAKGSPPKPWEKQSDETLHQFRCFCFYRDMQRRSLRNCAKGLGYNNSRFVEKLCQEHKWVERCAAWDTELDRRVRDEMTKDIADMKSRHINIGIGMQTAVVKELQAWVAKIEEAAEQAKKAGRKFHNPLLNINDLIRLSQHGTQLERLNRGEPTDHTKISDPEAPDLSRLSVAQLKALKEIKKALAGEG